MKRLLAEKLRIPSASELANYNYITLSYSWCLRQFGLQEITKDQSGIHPINYLGSANSLRNKGMKVIDRRLEADPDCAPTIAEEMYSMLQSKNRLKTELRTDYHRTQYVCKGPSRPMITTKLKKKRRVRTEWAKEEEAIFQNGVLNHKTAREIADALFIRTPEDVRLHLRTENKKRAHRNPPDPPLSLGKVRDRKKKLPCPLAPPATELNQPSLDSDSDSLPWSSSESFLSDFTDEEESSSNQFDA